MAQATRVLVVDDDEVVGRSIDRTLTEQGYSVREAHNGKEALEEFAAREYDLVFADIRMPGIDGLEVASRMKAMHPGVPVVIITGYGSESNQRRARELGVSGFLEKPLTPEMIIGNAKRVLRERSETMEAIRQSALGLITPTVAAAAAPAAAQESVIRNLGLFVAAPFIGLAYILAFPFVGLWAMCRHGLKALSSHR